MRRMKGQRQRQLLSLWAWRERLDSKKPANAVVGKKSVKKTVERDVKRDVKRIVKKSVKRDVNENVRQRDR